ncbi:MAG TPA: DUF4082 domain-containing protein [Thermoanaerobaculia bacterium]|nr:DUF4082 domain-containing protein [Thermoanaerobaculia bacterium]
MSVLSAASAHAARPAAQGVPPHLFTLEKTPLAASASSASSASAASRAFLPDAAEEFLIQADPAAVNANPATFTIDLPDTPLLEAVRTRFVVYGPDWKSWIGTLRYAGAKGKGAGYIHLGYHGDRMTALIQFEGQSYRILGGGRQESHRLARIAEDKSPMSCGLEETEERPELSEAQLATAPAAAAPAIDSVTSAVLATYRIDVLAVYPRAFFVPGGPSAETALGNFIRDSISLANDAFANSQIDAAYNLVGIVPLTGTQPTGNSVSSALTWLNTQTTTAGTEVNNLRTAFGADVVTIFVPWSWNGLDVCGIANMYNNSTSYFAGGSTATTCRDASNNPTPCDLGRFMLSAQRDGCGLADYTLGHEIGHNYGMWHNEPPTQAAQAFPNGLGHILTVGNRGLATVMGCFCTGSRCTNVSKLGSGAICNRIPYFSDPTINYLSTGVPTGTSTRNNAAVGRAQVPSFSSYRAPSSNTPPTANFTVSCSGRTCTFNGTSSTDNSGISSYWWDFGNASATGTGSTASYTYPAAGASFPVHLVVTDNQGQTSVKAGIAEPQTAPSYEGYHENANCSIISGWAWDQNLPNTPIKVSLDRDNTHITTIDANLFRQDLVNAGKGNGSHAFSFTVDDTWKDGVSHSVRVRHNSSTTSLTWSPRTILCGVMALTNMTPLNSGSTGGVVYTVGTQFSSSVNGTITHLGFYRAPNETDFNTAYLWANGGGTPLASVLLPSANPTTGYPSGWIWGKLSTPVSITAGTLYWVGVNTNTQQAKTNCGLSGGVTNSYLTAHGGAWIAGDGVFPTNGSCSNFFADVKFDPQ